MTFKKKHLFSFRKAVNRILFFFNSFSDYQIKATAKEQSLKEIKKEEYIIKQSTKKST